MINVFVQTRKTIQLTGGYKLQNGMACHKNLTGKEKDWDVVDLASGLLIKENLTCLKECIDYAKNNPDKEKIEKARSSKHYKEYVTKIEEWKKKELSTESSSHKEKLW